MDASLIIPFLAAAVSLADPFAVEVLDYSPAPGQFTDNPAYNDPADALGPPAGMGISDGNTQSVVTLGGFGGSIVLRFDHTVEDDPLNPHGMDAIVFSNSFWVGGNPERHWAECAVIEISLDVNGNGLADDPWFVIPGSHYAGGTWIQDAFLLPVAPFGGSVIVNSSPMPGAEAVWGYAEYSPTLLLGDLDADNLVDDPAISPAKFYTVPDDPFAVGTSAGAGGGDAFDIAWAIDPTTGNPAGLVGFDFIRLTTAVQSSLGPLGEKSAEIDAVADVAPDYFGDSDDDLDLDLFDVAEVLVCLGQVDAYQCNELDRAGAAGVDASDLLHVICRLTGPR